MGEKKSLTNTTKCDIEGSPGIRRKLDGLMLEQEVHEGWQFESGSCPANINTENELTGLKKRI